LLKKERKNEWHNEFLKLKKNYNKEYLKKKKLKMMKENIKM
jgi:hypothetical protein